VEHFRIIQSLCRIGLGSDNPAFRHQVDRLIGALEKQGANREANTLRQMLTVEYEQQKLKPSRVITSGAGDPGEVLSVRTLPPVDRETGAPLAEIHHPADADLVSPIFAPRLEQAVQNLIAEWANFDRLAEIGVPPARTCLFFGPPGTGKTRLAYFVAASLQLPIITARLDGLISSFLGTTARNLGNLFDFANRYRCLLLLDEFDAVAKVRDDPQEIGEIKRVVNTLLQNIDARSDRGLTIAITNHERLLDKAVWRRFETRISIPPPGPTERAAILERYLPPLETSTHFIAFLSWLTEGMTGSELQTLVHGLKRNAAINGGTKSLIENVQAIALTNANLSPPPRMALLFGGFPKLAVEVMKDTQAGITQAGLAAVLQKDQTTISRWLRSEMAEEALAYGK
jgi:hypothetical protein